MWIAVGCNRVGPLVIDEKENDIRWLFFQRRLAKRDGNK